MAMQGRAFLELAREVVTGTTEAHWRGAAVHAYYALFLESREALTRWAISLPLHSNTHASVRLRFTYAADFDLKQIGDALDKLGRLRNKASYDLTSPGVLAAFADSSEAQNAIQRAADTLALLDTIDADPVRKAAAIASFPP
jgi:hypothetical protein